MTLTIDRDCARGAVHRYNQCEALEPAAVRFVRPAYRLQSALYLHVRAMDRLAGRLVATAPIISTAIGRPRSRQVGRARGPITPLFLSRRPIVEIISLLELS
jgi:hypothetical protein